MLPKDMPLAIRDAVPRIYAGLKSIQLKNQPEIIALFRHCLSSNNSVKQIFDPWYMDENTKDNFDKKPNSQFSENEKLHAHHLHITICDGEIL